MEVREEDLIFNEEVEPTYKQGDTILANGEEFIIEKFINSKQISDKLGFPAIYSWYKARTDIGNQVNIFMFDEDVDSVEINDLVAEKWFDYVYNNSENY